MPCLSVHAQSQGNYRHGPPQQNGGICIHNSCRGDDEWSVHDRNIILHMQYTRVGMTKFNKKYINFKTIYSTKTS